MAFKKELVSSIPVNDYYTVHPALDFYSGKTIVSIGCKWMRLYNNNDLKFETTPFCIISDGDKFEYTKNELAKRKLYHSGHLDIPAARWEFADIEAFSNEPSSLTIPELFAKIKDIFIYYMDFDDKRIYSLLACFVIYTYFYPLFNTAPLLQLWGEFRTGKTKVCSLLEAMCFNPVNSANISSASVFRLIESRRATILLDESEDLLTSERSRDIRNMLLAGTGKSGETYRQEKSANDNYTTQTYKVFSPKIIANIAGIDIASLQSRIIQIVTTGSSNVIKLNRDVSQDDECWKEVRSQLYRTCLLQSLEVITMRDKLPTHELTGRTFKIWQGILTIASLSGFEIWEDLLAYAKENKENMESEMAEFGDDPVDFIDKLISIADENSTHLTATELLEKLNFSFNILSTKELAVKVGRFGMKSKLMRYNNKVARFYILNKEKLLEIRKKYFRVDYIDANKTL